MKGLLANELLTQEIGNVKSNIERIISSYRHIWDIYTELLQNGGDAILEKHGDLSKGKLSLKVDTKLREITVSDNGIGISSDDIHKILVTGKSLKRDSNNAKFGFMGFGFTFVAFQTEYLKVETIKDGYKSTATYKDLYKFVFENSQLPMSQEELSGNNNSIECGDESGTIVTIRLPSTFPLEEVEESINSAFELAKNDQAFEIALRTKTVVGNLDSLFEQSKIFDFQLIVDDSPKSIDSGYLTTREIVKRVFNNTEPQFYDKASYESLILATSQIPDSSKDSARKAILLDHIEKDVKIGSKNPLLADMYFSATSKLNVNNFVNKVGSDLINIPHGIWLSICGMPIGICLDSFEHANSLPYTIVVNIKNPEIRRDLDAGRKGLSTYRQKQISTVANDLLTSLNFKKYRRYVAGNIDTRVTNPLYDAKKELQKKYKDKSPLSVDLINKYQPLVEEQEVISLFMELASKKIIKGYTLKAMSGFQVYDAMFDYRLENSSDNLFGEDNLLGIYEGVFKQHGDILDKQDTLVEYKLKLAGLYQDIDMNKKDVSQIDLLICWEVEDKEKLLQERGDALLEKDPNINIFHGVTHSLTIAGKVHPLPIIELKTVMQSVYNI